MCCKMKLDQSLKLYIGLYFICFMFSWLVSIPMILHVSRDGECLLFVTPYITYGPAAGCWVSGLGFIAVGVAAVILFVLHIMQLMSLKKYLRQPGPHSSKDYHSRPTRVFWPMVVFHGVTTFAVLALTSIITSGYATSCQNLFQDVSKTVNSRINIPGTQINAAYDQYADSRSIDRYLNNNYQESNYRFGSRGTEQYISCRKLFTDWENTRRLKENYNVDPRNRRYWGNSGGFHDYGNIRYYTWRNNMSLELAIAGSWISFVAWLIVFILMITLRQHLKAHLTDESMWGSQYGGRSRYGRSSSRMSDRSFDAGSRISNQSGSRYSGYRGGSRHNGNKSLPDQMSYQGSLQDGPTSRSKYLSPNYKPSSQMSSNGSAKGHPSTGSSRGRNTHDRNNSKDATNPDSSLLKYFAEHPPVEEEVDIDFALNDQCLDERDGNHLAPNHYPEQDTSFGSEGLPVGLDNTMNGLGDPLPLGDEVSEGRLSEARDLPSFNTEGFQCNTILHAKNSPCPSPKINYNPNRVQGRRGGGRSGGPSTRPSQPQTFTVTQEFSHHSVQKEVIKGNNTSSRDLPPLRHERGRLPPPASNTTPAIDGYKTQLGNQSLI